MNAIPFSLPGCHLDAVDASDGLLTLLANPSATGAICPTCGIFSRRVHSYYTRCPGDLPVSDQAVRLRLTLRRFRCIEGTCPRRTFAEPVPDLVAPYARRTLRLETAQRDVAFFAGAEAGSRLLALLRMAASPDVLLRLMRRCPQTEAPVPRVLGVDDWAWRRGRAWGTLLVDLERRRPVDLLPDRTAETLAAWLRDHPGIEVVARDRSTEYTRAITEAAPEALQVADRWHLLHSLRQVLVRYLTSARARLRELPHIVDRSTEPVGWHPQRRSRTERAASEAARARRCERYVEVRRLHYEDGLNILQIRRATGINRTTIRKYLTADAFPEWGKHPPVQRALAPYEGHLTARWAEGGRNALALWREIRELGYAGSPRQVSRWAQQQRTEPHPCTPGPYRMTSLEKPAPSGSLHKLMATRQLAWLLVQEPSRRTPAEESEVAHICQDGEVASLYRLAQSYTQMIRQRRAAELDPWLRACASSGISPLVSFGVGLQRDYAAVRAALEEPWSSGQAEGQINRLKLLKRQMYGRASFALLRQRVLYAA